MGKVHHALVISSQEEKKSIFSEMHDSAIGVHPEETKNNQQN